MIKRIIIALVCIVAWISIDLAVIGGPPPPVIPATLTPTAIVPPVMPPPVILTPTPTLPFDGDGAKQMPDGEGDTKKPPQKEIEPTVAVQKEKAKPKHYVIIGMYDRMLEQARHKRRWPVDDPVDGCVLMHDGESVCQ